MHAESNASNLAHQHVVYTQYISVVIFCTTIFGGIIYILEQVDKTLAALIWRKKK